MFGEGASRVGEGLDRIFVCGLNKCIEQNMVGGVGGGDGGGGGHMYWHKTRALTSKPYDSA